jgi:hypothetical protein
MRRWGLWVGGIVLLGALLSAAGWHDLTTARAQLNEARLGFAAVVNNPASLRSPDGRAGALRTVDDALGSVRRARGNVRGSTPLRLAGWLPGLHRQRAGVLDLVDDAESGAVASRQLLVDVDGLAGSTVLTDGALPLDGLERLERALRDAGGRLEHLSRTPRGLWPSVAFARRQLNDVASTTSTRLINAADGLAAARTFVGAAGPRRYFVAVQNNAEMRDQGMVLSYAVVSFRDGRMTVEHTGPIAELALSKPADIGIPPGTLAAFRSLEPTRQWQSVNATADFGWSAKAMTVMYRQATGQDVDGVIALDVPGLAALLRVVGPIDVAGAAEPVTADNASRILLHDFYDLVPRGDQTLRKERLAEFAAAVVARLSTGSHDAVALGREIGAAAGGGHFRLFSTDAREERVFERTGLGGGPADTASDRTFHISVQNGTATKLDYFVRQHVRMDVYLSERGTAVVRTALTVHNTAPSNGKPSYQLGPDGFKQKRPGEYVARVYYWGPQGGRQVNSLPEAGLLLDARGLVVEPGAARLLEFETAIPDAVRSGRLDLRLVPQASLVPADLDVRLHAPGWHVAGEAHRTLAWDRTTTMSWDVAR